MRQATTPLRRWTQSIVRASAPLAELRFPPGCVVCRGLVPRGGPGVFCNVCVERLDLFQAPFCQGCGASVPAVVGELRQCGRCAPHHPRYDRAVALGPYEGLLRELLLRAKKPHGEITAAALARLLAVERGELLREWNVDVVCPVPMHWRRRTVRLASRAETLAEVKEVSADELARKTTENFLTLFQKVEL